MIPTKNRRLKAMKLPRNIEKLYKEGKCRDCAVVITRMDFARILGKFTKVKIQYETSKKPKGKTVTELSINTKTKQKTNENGIVQRKTFNNHSKERSHQSKENDVLTSKSVIDVLKENNRLKQPMLKDKNSNYDTNASINPKLKQYGIMFTSPSMNHKNDINNMSLVELLPSIDDSILPSEEWCIDYFPKNDEPKDDKVYDRIAAELEDLMNNGKSVSTSEDKSDDFPSIMDILNDNTTETNKSTDQSHSTEFKTNLESNDVESILLGKSEPSKTPEATPMDVDNSTDVSNLIADVEQFNAIQPVNPTDANVPDVCVSADIENPHSPSILDEALQKGIEEHLPPGINVNINQEETTLKTLDENIIENNMPINESKSERADEKEEINSVVKNVKVNIFASKAECITELVFKKNLNGQCCKSVTCPKNLKYKIELNGKSVEFIGAPKFISSLEELQILLQIVNESDLKSFYVLQ